MNTRIGMYAIIGWATLGWGVAYAWGQAAQGETLLDEIRSAMAARELSVAKAKLEEAAKLPGSEAFVAQRERLQLLYQYLEEFWKSVDEGAKTLHAVDELVIGDTRVAVVESRPGWLVLRVNGENRRYTAKTLPAKVALTLAQRVLKPDAPQNKLFFGTFFLLDGRGDRELARKMWTEARQAKVDVAALLPELDVTPVASLPIEIPPVTPIMRRLLAPASWSLRRQVGDRVVREPLKDCAEQTTDGQLKIAPPGDAGAAQLVYSQRLAGNFGCRLILLDVGDGQLFGLFAGDSLEAAHQVPLPKGSVMVEFARQGGTFQCRINQKEVPVEPRGGAAPNMVGMIGVTLPAGARCTVAWFELQAR